MTRQEFKRLMTHKLTIEKRKRSVTGDWETVETYKSIPGFVEYGKRKSVDEEGEEITVNAVVFLMPDSPINVEHGYWLITQTHPYKRSPMHAVNIIPIDDPRTGKTHHIEIETRMGAVT